MLHAYLLPTFRASLVPTTLREGPHSLDCTWATEITEIPPAEPVHHKADNCWGSMGPTAQKHALVAARAEARSAHGRDLVTSRSRPSITFCGAQTAVVFELANGKGVANHRGAGWRGFKPTNLGVYWLLLLAPLEL